MIGLHDMAKDTILVGLVTSCKPFKTRVFLPTWGKRSQRASCKIHSTRGRLSLAETEETQSKDKMENEFFPKL